MKISGSYILVVGAIAVIGAMGATIMSSVGVAQNAPVPPPQSATEGHIEGVVSEIVDVPGYTYAEVETADGKVWAAAPSVSVRVGDTVSFSAGLPMANFYSKALQREFGVLYFVDQFISDEGITPIDREAAAAHGQFDQQASVTPVQEIRKPEGGVAIAEIYARGDELRGQTVRVRGQVIKFTAGVMNTNWVRIRDGSGTDDLVIPTDATFAVSDIILVEGRLVLDMDLGQGYVIPAVLEDAEITTE